ncbi:hypothetical protein LPN04_28960 [Rugamonas sp. A1-17]|nr:hypothetical protein [Rugamonas sp. A1-17]
MIPPLSVYIAPNVWDFLYDRRINLATALPSDRFCLAITREAKFEIPLIPDDKADLKDFITVTIARCTIRADSLFGFYDGAFTADEQRFGGLDEGRWASKKELDQLAQQRTPLSQVKRKTGLYKNEADRALALRAIHSLVLSLDEKKGTDQHCLPARGKGGVPIRTRRQWPVPGTIYPAVMLQSALISAISPKQACRLGRIPCPLPAIVHPPS